MPDKDQLYPKYLVFHHPQALYDFTEAKTIVVGGDAEEEETFLVEVDGFFFVLKPDTDKHARVALAAYAESVADEFPGLAKDLRGYLLDV